MKGEGGKNIARCENELCIVNQAEETPCIFWRNVSIRICNFKIFVIFYLFLFQSVSVSECFKKF